MRPHPKSLPQPTLPPAVEQAIQDVRSLLAAVPQNLVADQDGADVFLSTGELLAAKEPQVYGVIYADDDQGKAIAELVLRVPALLDTLVGHLEQSPIMPAATVAIAPSLEERPARKPDPKPVIEAKPALPISKEVAEVAKLHLKALEVAQEDPTRSLPPAEGWTTVECPCGKAFWWPPIRKGGKPRCYQCMGNQKRQIRLQFLHVYLPKEA